jgi:hypothetical protein
MTDKERLDALHTAVNTYLTTLLAVSACLSGIGRAESPRNAVTWWK